MNIAETERLLLRPLEVSDAEDLFHIYSAPEMMKYLGGGPSSLDEERQRIAGHIEGYYEIHGFGLWAVVLRETGKLIGRSGLLYPQINGRNEAELAYLVGRDWWRKGIATEAARAVLKVAEEQFNFSRVVAIIHPDNAGSIGVAKKLGFELESRIDSYKDFGNVLLFARHQHLKTANEATVASI